MKLNMLTALTLLLCLLPASTRGHKPGVVKVQVDSDAILPCSPSTKENLVLKVFDWIKENDIQRDVFLYASGVTSTGADKFKGRVSHFTDELKNGNASIIIRNAKIEDSGNYTCVFPHLESQERFHVELVVGASSKPHIMRVNVTEDRIQLQCLVQGASSKPEVQFQDSAGNVLPAEEHQIFESGQRYTVILITTVTKTDLFRCVAKQKEIHHETSAEINVTVYEKQFEDTCSKAAVTGWFVGVFFLGVFSVVAVQALVVRTKNIKIHKGPCQQTQTSDDSSKGSSESDEPLKSLA
ncbi:butyrophilin subfamily 2 member A2 isoform X2 [Larimichthys crocea]|uniref:butyrophilin subfamily 2 member A2 isoform X2 n=1 Tax=Larimichthys crocea TaxID=215358 RepID=UPI000F5E983D|nr:butyrophilin subfamily 2 member A2 isoform X2 [Larimichthys crocea]